MMDGDMAQHKVQSVDSVEGLPSCFEELGLTEPLLRRAVETGLRHYQRATPFHPRTHGGCNAWGEIVAVVRQMLKVKGWSPLDLRGLPMACHGEAGISIVVTSGDKNTGIREGEPSSRNPKGEATNNYVSHNLDLFTDPITEKTDDSLNNKTWVLLYYFDFKTKEVRFELSLPLNLSPNGYFNKWLERHIFEPVAFSDDQQNVDLIINSEFNDDIDFDIAIRT